MQEIQERLGHLQEELKKALNRLNLNEKERALADYEQEMQATDFWGDAEKAQKTSQFAGQLRRSIQAWRDFEKELQDAIELAQLLESENDPKALEQLGSDLKNLETRFEKMQVELYLSGPFDAGAAIIAVHAGTGGVDAQDFAEMLLRMLLRYCQRKNFKTTQLDHSPAAEAGIKSASFKAEGDFAYGLLKNENGVHRLVRMSPFNSGGTRETSFALVEVLPEVEDSELEIREEDLKWDVFRSGGSGGQSVNTTDSAVRLTHVPTGIVVQCQNERSQLQNKQQALKTLRSKLVALQEKHRLDTIQDIKGEHVQHSWGNQIRSYVLHPYQMVKDHRTGVETNQVDKVLDGDLDEFIEGSLKGVKTG